MSRGEGQLAGAAGSAVTDQGARESVRLPAGIDAGRLSRLLRLAIEEDLGDRGDVTTRLCGLEGTGRGVLIARRAGWLCGAALLEVILREIAPHVGVVERSASDGERIAGGQVIAVLAGPLEEILAAERTILNLLARLSGIATLTRAYVDAVAGTQAKIFDTRKTVPGWRDLDRYAVRCGGGWNHRHGLHDAVLIKDNHVAGLASEALGEFVARAVAAARALDPPPAFVEVEADSLSAVDVLLGVDGVDAILLDNFRLPEMAEAVRRRDASGRDVVLEASGGVTLGTVRAVAETGVDRISVGALTHSAPALDIALERQ